MKCKKCKEDKPLTEDHFPKEKRNTNGFKGTCKVCTAKYQKEYHEKHKKRIQEYNSKHRKEISKRYYERNKEHLRERARIRMSTPEAKKKTRERLREKRRTDPSYRISNNVSRSIRKTLHGIFEGKKTKRRTFDYLPYSPQDLVEHLESQFDDKMSWDNYGSYWHVDHVYPQSLLPYDSYDHPNFLRCWALDNLQPLEAGENMSKGNKIIKTQERVIAIDV